MASGPGGRKMAAPLLARGDPAPVSLVNRRGCAPFLLVGDHAGAAIPSALGDLGLSAADRSRHIALDIGSDALGRSLARRLDARFVRQRYSRLVIDCNRAPERSDAIPAESDRTAIAGNAALRPGERASRVAAIHAPYHAAIAAELGRDAATILVALHSFTPVWQGAPRPWHVGVLHGGGADHFARRVLTLLVAELGAERVGDNVPYRLDYTDYTVPRHAIAAGRPYVELEVRQDLLATPAGISTWSRRLARVLRQALHDQS